MFGILIFMDYGFLNSQRQLKLYKDAKNRNYSHFIKKNMEKGKGQKRLMHGTQNSPNQARTQNSSL